MKRIALSFYAISTFIVFILMSCTDQMTNNEDARQIIISASLRDHTPHTRVSITQDSESLNLLPKWEEDDKIDLFIIQDKNVYPVTSVPIRDIREGGSTCTISLTIPYQVDTEKPYTIIGLFDIEGETDADGQVKVKTQLKRLRWDTPTTPMYFKADGGPRSLIATFEHIGTYELLHIKNTSNKGIFFQHCGFETETPWYKYEDEIIVGKQETPQSTIFEKGEVTSGRYFIPKNESFNILSWYIPSGVQIRNAKLKSVIDGNQVVSSNAKNSSVQLQRGHAYHMYATWDGTELKFGKEEITEEPTIEITPTKIDFGTVPEGSTAEEHFTVTNHGQADLVFKIGQASEPITISEAGVEHTLTSGQSKQFTVTCAGMPEDEGVQTHINITSNATNVEWGFGIDIVAKGGNASEGDPGDAYAVLNDEVLTFYCDKKREQRSGESFDLNTTERPGWYSKRSNIYKIVFDESFATARPTSMYSWFAGAHDCEFEGVENLNTSEVTTMKELFYGYDGYELDLRFLNTSNVTDMTAMFRECERLKSVNLSSFNTSKVQNMTWMFDDCYHLEDLDIKNFDTSNVEEMHSMFGDCQYLSELDLSNFNTSKVKTMFGMFWNCGFETLNIKFDTSNVTDMDCMFYGCGGLVHLDLSTFNTVNVQSMKSMFYECRSLESLDLSNFNTSNVHNMDNMFFGCSSLKHLDISNFNTSKTQTMWYMFAGCESLTNLDVSHFDTSNVYEMAYMFEGCKSLISLDVSHFNTSKATSMGHMFDSCESLQSLNVSGFSTSNVTDMSWMFKDCKSLKSLDVSHFNTSKVYDHELEGGYRSGLEGMFSNCTNITTLDLSGFTLQNEVKTNSMFFGCSNLKTIYMKKTWNLTKITSSDQMFEECRSLVGGQGTKYDSNHIDSRYARIDGGANSPGYFTQK